MAARYTYQHEPCSAPRSSAGERPVTMDRARLERQMREIALEHAAARLDDAEYLTRMARLRGELEIVEAHQARVLPARRATEWLDAFAEIWPGGRAAGRPTSAGRLHASMRLPLNSRIGSSSSFELIASS